MKKNILLTLFTSCLITYAFGNVRLPSILGSHMVLQQNSDIKLWGWSEPNEKIKITTDWDTITYRMVGTRDANWQVIIKTPQAGGPHTITIAGYNTVVLDDILVGEVWLCSGQSNMEMSASWNKQALEEMPNATNTSIRFFRISRATSDYPQDDAPGHWAVCSPEEMKYFSALGYFFGKKLQPALKMPVGLISSSWGGTPAEAWTPKEIVTSDAVLKEASDKLINSNTYPGWPMIPGKAYNAMISPITNYVIAGALWYQGESNVTTYSTYSKLLTAMIGSWRKAWNKDFPFYFVQIAPYAYGDEHIAALLRTAQTTVLSYPKTGMVITSDLVDNVNDIHPINKADIGLRLANYALADTYGKTDLAYKTPLYKSMSVEKNKIRISFENVITGLMTKGGDATEFYIAGDDQKFLPATVKIDGATVVVWNKAIKNPVAVRFGFSNTAMPNLYSKEGLPVNLFRTDNWTVSTAPVKK
jgi:sialate O-acetylesterase